MYIRCLVAVLLATFAITTANVTAQSNQIVYAPLIYGRSIVVIPSDPYIPNSNFEAGPTEWQWSGNDNATPILQYGAPKGLDEQPPDGTWAAKLGSGTAYRLAQAFTLPEDQTSLQFHWRVKGPYGSCTDDLARVQVWLVADQTQPIGAAWGMCSSNESMGWQIRTLDLSEFAGQKIVIEAQGGQFPGDYLYVDDFKLIP